MRRFQLLSISNTSKTIAITSLLSFSMQIVFALLMLHWFTPKEVGEFSVISQIAFFWMTLALAQAPLTFLANIQHPPQQAARKAWYSTLLRGVCFMPFVALALWLSHVNLLPAFAWILIIAFFQMTWLLAQSFLLRTGSTLQHALVRILPPMAAAFFAMLGTWLAWDGPTLLISAMLGYAIGAWGLTSAWHDTPSHSINTKIDATSAIQQADNRGSMLRMSHTLTDALLATAIVIVWQRCYGAEETGWMTALLRVLGFVPSVLHMAWAQVKLSRGTEHPDNSQEWILAIVGCCVVLSLIAFCHLGLYRSWLSQHWLGVLNYVWPLAAWQSAACVCAAFSHRPFQTNSETKYSWACIGTAMLQSLALLAPLTFTESWDVAAHVQLFAATSTVGLFTLAFWMTTLRSDR